MTRIGTALAHTFALAALSGCASTSAAGDATPGAGAVSDAEPAPISPTAGAEAVGATEPDTPAGDVIALPFLWPLPSAAWIVEDQEVKGIATRAEYRILATLEQDQVKITYAEQKPLTGAGGRPLDPETQQLADQIQKSTATALPALLANRQGDFVAVTDLEPVIDATLAAMPDLSDEERQMIATNMRSPQMLHMMEQRYGLIWNAWVGFFAGSELVLGEPVAVEDVAGRATYVLTGVDAATVRIEMTYVFNADQLIAQLRVQMRDMLERMELDPSEVEQMLATVDADKTLTVRARLWRDTLQPIEIEREELTRMRLPEQPEKTQREWHHYTFRWDGRAASHGS